MEPTPEQRVYGIASVAFAGSTLLSFLLGAHRRVFSTGEACQLFDYLHKHDSKNERLRSCSIHHDRCEFWTPSIVARCEDKKISFLHDRIKRYSPARDVVMHSFQNPKTYKKFLRGGSRLDGFVLLFKRPVAHYYSAKIHKGRTIAAAAIDYTETYREILELISEHRIATFPIYYEDLATNPRSVLKSLSAWMDLAFDPQMTEPWNCTERLHTIGGNAGTYMHVWDNRVRESVLNSPYWKEEHSDEHRRWLKENFRQIKLDEKWKTLPAEEISGVEARADSREMFERLLAQCATRPK